MQIFIAAAIAAVVAMFSYIGHKKHYERWWHLTPQEKENACVAGVMKAFIFVFVGILMLIAFFGGLPVR